MKINITSEKSFYMILLAVTFVMVSLFIWRINIAEHELKSNIDERIQGISLRVANNVKPLVYNIYQKSTERHFTEETASAILDSELSPDFVYGIKVYGNFGHLFMGKYKDTQGNFAKYDEHILDFPETESHKKIRTPVKQDVMTIGNIEVHYSYKTISKQLNKIIIRELLQISLLTLLIISLFYLIRKSLRERSNAVKAYDTLKYTQQQLISSEKSLKEANLTLEDKVIARTYELKTMNEQLLLATKAADTASKAKSLFLANMSHEIRTPMNGVIGLTELILRTKLTSVQKDYLEKLQYSSNNLLHILNDILDLSKIEAGKFTIEQTEFNFKQMLDSVVNTAKIKATEKKLPLNVIMDKSFSDWVIGDSVRCSQVLINLLNNAVKFTERGSITLEVERKNNSDNVFFKVTDTGIGITSEQQAKLFSTFTQADNSTSRKYGGTGLGLVICKHLTNLMGGYIELQSEFGQGSCFKFSLNLPVSKNNQNTYSSNDSDKKNSEINYTSEKLLNKKALVVEDIAINRLVAKKILKAAGLSLDFAVNGLEAVNMVKEKQYDLIIMDIQMPVMDGIESTKIIRTLANYKLTPIIAMTANAMSDDKELSLAAGMNSHLTKPIQFDQVIKELENFF